MGNELPQFKIKHICLTSIRPLRTLWWKLFTKLLTCGYDKIEGFPRSHFPQISFKTQPFTLGDKTFITIVQIAQVYNKGM